MTTKRMWYSGFTLIELLVVIAVISVLMAILIPSLRVVKERAKRIVCASHLQQIGQGIVVYTSNYDDRLPAPPTGNIGRMQLQTISIISYLATSEDVTGAPGKRIRGPYNLGHLFHEKIIESPEILYCPSSPKDYRYEDYAEQYGWHYDTSIHSNSMHYIPTSYHYVPQGKRRVPLESGYSAYQPVLRLSQINNRAPLALDRIDYSTLYNVYARFFRHNSRNVAGMNILYGDGHVRFRVSNDQEKDLWSKREHGSSLDDDAFRELLYSFCE